MVIFTDAIGPVFRISTRIGARILFPLSGEKQPFTYSDFQCLLSSLSANSGDFSESVPALRSKPFASSLGESTRREGR